MKRKNLSVEELKTLLINRELTAEDLTAEYIRRIRNSELNSFITINEKASKDAAHIDELVRKGEPLPPLAGVIVAVKDNISTKGLRTTCASKMLEGYIPPYDATVVERLKKAGAVIIGKTNMDEFGMGSTSENSIAGPVKNPYDKYRTAGGSSGGSAAAVAGGECMLAIGSDTGGSVRQPAAMCGIVGFKPTYGTTSRYGLIAFSSSLEQIGAMGTNIADTALLQRVISGPDRRDSTCITPVNYNIPETVFRGLRIGVPEELFSEGISEMVRSSVMKALKTAEKQGAVLVSARLPHIRYSVSTYYIISSAEASSNLGRYDSIRFGHRAGAADISRSSRSEGFGKEVKRRIMLGTYVLSAGYSERCYRKAMKMRRQICQELEQCFANCDLIAAPTCTKSAFPLGQLPEDPTELYSGDICTVPANLAGLPAISFPCGSDNNLPIGMQLIGRSSADNAVFGAAAAFEREWGGFREIIRTGGV